MANRFPLQVLNTMKLFTEGLLALLFATLLSGSALAATPTDTGTPSLRPYSAQYKTKAMGMSLSLTRKLKVSADGSYTLTNGGKMMVVSFHEVSVFTTRGTDIIPKSYVYEQTGLANRRREVHFTPGSDTIRSLYKDQWYDLPYTEGTLDRMSQLEQLRLLLLSDSTPQEDIAIRVADRKRVKDYQWRFVSEDTLETSLGSLKTSLKTLHFERLHDDPDRKSDLWVAPDLDYLMVKTVHIENGKPVEVILTSADIEGLGKPGK